MRRRLIASVGAALAIGLLVAACGSGSDSATPTTVPLDPTCPLTLEASAALIGDGVTATQPPALGDGVPVPMARCQYQAGGSTLQFTLFPGPDMLEQLKSLLSSAEPAPDVSPGAYCSTYQRESTTTVGCVFLNGTNTMTLSLNVPNTDLTPSAQADVRALAVDLAGTPVGS